MEFFPALQSYHSIVFWLFFYVLNSAMNYICVCVLGGVVVKVKGLTPQSCRTLCDTMDCSPPGSSLHGILQAGMELVAIPFSRGYSWPRDWTWVACISDGFLHLLNHQGSPLCVAVGGAGNLFLRLFPLSTCFSSFTVIFLSIFPLCLFSFVYHSFESVACYCFWKIISHHLFKRLCPIFFLLFGISITCSIRLSHCNFCLLHCFLYFPFLSLSFSLDICLWSIF